MLSSRKLFRCTLSLVMVLGGWLACPQHAAAQQQGVPGKFDFYLLDLPWGPEFCAIKDVSAQCKPQRGFVVHGLWPQHFDGTWPVFCSKETRPANLAQHLSLTPDLQLLQHEWDKHGTCSAAGPQRFFAMEREAFSKVRIPSAMQAVHRDLAFTPEWIVQMFQFENPAFPQGSFVLSCSAGRLASVEACFDKSLNPIQCVGLHSCQAQVLVVKAPLAQ